MGLHPLVSMVARPVKHVRLVTALLKAIALMRSKAQVSCPPVSLTLRPTQHMVWRAVSENTDSASFLQEACEPGLLNAPTVLQHPRGVCSQACGRGARMPVAC